MASVTRPALTSTFTPAASCSNVFVSGNIPKNSYILTLGPPDQSTVCWPSGWNTATASYFSPGYICPSGMYSAFQVIPTATTDGLLPETQIVCCPNSYSYFPTLSAFRGEQCSSRVTIAQVVTVLTQDAVGGVHTTSLSVEPGDGVNAYGLNMRFRANDLATATSTSTSTGTSATTSSSAPATPSPTSDANTDSGLSSGAKAGIGIGVALGVLAISALIAFFLWRRARRARARGQNGANESMDSGLPLTGGIRYSSPVSHAGPDGGVGMSEQPLEGRPMSNALDGYVPPGQGRRNQNGMKISQPATYEMHTPSTPIELG